MKPDKPPHEFHLKIDRDQYTTLSTSLTGEGIRQLVSPPIPVDRDLYLVRPGDDDLLIQAADAVSIRDGLRFFTAPGHINPGSGRPIPSGPPLRGTR
ncbi:MAG: hypothetical protein QOJ79_1040 [Actinomycetota bacterium]|jgi:hypothetical protein|nr:hypothetical protein [Actinomycetota bacterium]